MGSRLVSRRSSLSGGEQDAVRRRCLVPQPQLDADTSHMLDTPAEKRGCRPRPLILTYVHLQTRSREHRTMFERRIN